MRNIEDLFKEALKDQELPYNKDAWSKMNKKLDARNPKSSNGFKWILGAAGAAVIIAAYLFLDSDNEPSQIQAEITKQENKLEDKRKETEKESATEISNKTEIEVETQEPVVVKSPENSITCCDDSHQKPSDEAMLKNTKSETGTELQQPVYREVEIITTKSDETRAPLHLTTPKDHCLNQNFTYKNTNEESIFILSPQENLEEITSKQTLDFKLDEKGVYQIGTLNQNQEFIAALSFNVHEPKNIQLSVDDYLNFENGLPELNVQAFSENQISWYINNVQSTKTGLKENFLLFNKGSYSIKAFTRDANGCESSDEVSFFVEKNYNLLAVNAFTPNSFDDRNTTFMPFALKNRNTPFKMIIIDPSNGAVIFETSDANQAWRGINKNTGELVKQNTSFVWKVILQNPEQGESPEYMGTVVRL